MMRYRRERCRRREFTRAAAFIASGEMAVGYFWMHQPRSLWPIGDPPAGNGGILAILFCFGFFLLVFTGGKPLDRRPTGQPQALISVAPPAVRRRKL
jgi:hypothetical protein